jgi:hypothetical protein
VAQHRHKRDTPARTTRTVLVATPVAVVATLSAVMAGVLASDPPTSEKKLLASTPTASFAPRTPNPSSLINRRDLTVSRSQLRSQLQANARARRKIAANARQEGQRAEHRATLQAVRSADDKLWTTEDLNLWNGPGEDSSRLGLVDALTQVLVTGRREGDRAEIVVDGESRWVTAAYLADSKPTEPDPPKVGPAALGGKCANGASITAGRAALYDIFNTVCDNWPQIVSYGTWRNDGEHGEGRAMDIMVSGTTGWAVADFLRANYAALDIEYLIYARNIWSVERADEGWRSMADRGSITANHLDHVHVTVY